MPHIIKFADALETVLVNNHPFNIQFGGPAVPITVNNTRHYIRLTELPPHVIPGEVEIVSMSHTRPKTSSTSIPSRAGGGAPWVAPHAKQPLRAQVETHAEEETEMGHESALPMHEPALPMHEPALPVRGGLGGLYIILNFVSGVFKVLKLARNVCFFPPVLSRGAPKKIMKTRPRQGAEPSRLTKMEDRQMPPELFQAIQPGRHYSVETSIIGFTMNLGHSSKIYMG